MTVDELARHLDRRLDKQDDDLKATVEKVTVLQVQAGKIETALSGAGEACKARHEDVTKKIAIRDKWLGVGIVGVVGAAAKLVWDAATGKGHG